VRGCCTCAVFYRTGGVGETTHRAVFYRNAATITDEHGQAQTVAEAVQRHMCNFLQVAAITDEHRRSRMRFNATCAVVYRKVATITDEHSRSRMRFNATRAVFCRTVATITDEHGQTQTVADAVQRHMCSFLQE
jgi:hypothetical protein